MAVSINGTNGITFNDGTAVGTAVSLGARNKIINGAMEIDQRNAGASVTPATNNYVLDRWAFDLSQSSKYSVQQSTVVPTGFKNSCILTSLSSYSIVSGDFFLMRQMVEGQNVTDLSWGTSGAKSISLSFWVRSSLTGTFGGSIRNSATDRSYVFSYSISSANTWEYKTVSVPGDTSGTWLTTTGVGLNVSFSIGTGSTYSTTAGAWTAGNYVAPTGAVSVVGTNGATFYLTGVQLEVGSVATPFERRLYPQELAMCQRYYETGYNIWSGYTNGSSPYYLATNYKVTKRATATLSFSSISGSGFPSSAPTVGENQTGYFRVDPSSNASSTAAYYQFLWASAAEL